MKKRLEEYMQRQKKKEKEEQKKINENIEVIFLKKIFLAYRWYLVRFFLTFISKISRYILHSFHKKAFLLSPRPLKPPYTGPKPQCVTKLQK